MAEQHDESPSRIIPVAILTLTALVIAAVPMRTWTGKRRKLSHPAPAEHPLPLPLPLPVPLSAQEEESAPEPEPDDKHGAGAGAGAGARGKRTKERRRRDNKARAARIPASVQALLDQPPPPGPTVSEAPAPADEPEMPMGAGAALAIDVPLPPDSDEDSLFGFGGTESVASTNATSIPTPLSLAASEVLPPVSDDWAQCAPPPPTVPSLDPVVLSGLRKELARARMDEAEQRSAAELALKECGRMADRCELLESELGEWKRRESEAQSQIQQLLHQLRAQPQPMPIPMPMHYQYFPPGAPVPMLHPLHMPPPQHQQQRAPYTPQSPMFLSPVFAPHPPPAQPQQQTQYPRTPSPYERERDVAEAILRRPDAVLADA